MRFIEGWETRRTTTHIGRLYASFTGTLLFGAGRKSGTALRNDGTGNNPIYVTRALVGSVANTWVVGFAFRLEAYVDVPGGCGAGVRLHNSVGEQVSLVCQPAGTTGMFKWELRRGATVIASSPAYFPGNQGKGWHYFQLKVTVRTGTNGSYELRSYTPSGSMTVAMSGSGVNLANQGTDGADRLEIRMDNIPASVMDDVFALDTAGSLNNDFLTGPVVCHGTLPTSDGFAVQWDISPTSPTTHFDKVDDGPGSVSDSDRISSATVGQKDLYGTSDLAISSDTTIHAVQVNIMGLMENSGTRTVAPRVRSGGSEANFGGQAFSSTTATTKYEILEQNPVGPAAWSKTSYNAAEIGVEVTV